MNFPPPHNSVVSIRPAQLPRRHRPHRNGSELSCAKVISRKRSPPDRTDQSYPPQLLHFPRKEMVHKKRTDFANEILEIHKLIISDYFRELQSEIYYFCRLFSVDCAPGPSLINDDNISPRGSLANCSLAGTGSSSASETTQNVMKKVSLTDSGYRSRGETPKQPQQKAEVG